MREDMNRFAHVTSAVLNRVQAFVPISVRRAETSVEGPSSKYGVFLIGVAVGLISSNLVFAEKEKKGLALADHPSRNSCKYLICGGGEAAQEALNVFIEKKQANDVILVSPEWRHVENGPPFLDNKEKNGSGVVSRMVTAMSSSFPVPFSTSEKPNIVIGQSIKALNPSSRIATLNNGSEIAFEKCLIAIGSTPVQIPIGKVVSNEASGLVGTAHSESDWHRINSIIQSSALTASADDTNSHTRAHFTVVGCGWMSVIVGAKLLDRGADVTFSYADPSFLSRCLPKYLGRDIYARLMWTSDGGADLLSYSAIRYVVARKPLQRSALPIEAEVHVGTVFDAFSIMEFRTDQVILAPTLEPSSISIEAPSLALADGAFVPNAELSVASDIYVAGSIASIPGGSPQHSPLMRWSREHARASGRHAARNMLGARESYVHSPTLTVDLQSLKLQLTMVGDVNGSYESFGYFVRGKERAEGTCGGTFERGILFCVKTAPLRFRGAAQELMITGITLWDGVDGGGFRDIRRAREAAASVIDGSGLSRSDMEAAMDTFVKEHGGISLYEKETQTDETQVEDDKKLKSGNGRRSRRVVWRRHEGARTVPLRETELLWIDDEWVGALSGTRAIDKKKQAYHDLFQKSAGRM